VVGAIGTAKLGERMQNFHLPIAPPPAAKPAPDKPAEKPAEKPEEMPNKPDED
jgi:hypothetical protein